MAIIWLLEVAVLLESLLPCLHRGRLLAIQGLGPVPLPRAFPYYPQESVLQPFSFLNLWPHLSCPLLSEYPAHVGLSINVCVVGEKWVVRPQSNIPLIFSKRFLLLDPKIVADCSVVWGERSVKEHFIVSASWTWDQILAILWRLEPAGWPAGPDVGCERDQGGEDTPGFLVWVTGKWRLHRCSGENQEGRSGGGEGVSSQFGTWKFKILKILNLLFLSFLSLKKGLIISHVITENLRSKCTQLKT